MHGKEICRISNINIKTRNTGLEHLFRDFSLFLKFIEKLYESKDHFFIESSSTHGSWLIEYPNLFLILLIGKKEDLFSLPDKIPSTKKCQFAGRQCEFWSKYEYWSCGRMTEKDQLVANIAREYFEGEADEINAYEISDCLEVRNLFKLIDYISIHQSKIIRPHNLYVVEPDFLDSLGLKQNSEIVFYDTEWQENFRVTLVQVCKVQNTGFCRQFMYL